MSIFRSTQNFGLKVPTYEVTDDHSQAVPAGSRKSSRFSPRNHEENSHHNIMPSRKGERVEDSGHTLRGSRKSKMLSAEDRLSVIVSKTTTEEESHSHSNSARDQRKSARFSKILPSQPVEEPLINPPAQALTSARNKKEDSSARSARHSKTISEPIKPPQNPLPDELKFAIHNFAIPEYAQLYFRQQRGLFSRKIPVEKNLEFTKSVIKESMLTSCDELNKEAIEIFKGVQEYMGERKIINNKDPYDVVLSILKTAVDNPQLRDEFYIQLIKQTSLNPGEKSEERGWELFSMLLETNIIPSQGFFETLVTKHFSSALETSPHVRIRQIAKYTTERLKLLLLKPRTPVLPNSVILKYAKEIPFIDSVFRSTINQMMEYQKDIHPKLQIPVILRTLIDSIITSGGLTSVGIFRVNANKSDIYSLREKLEENHGEPLLDIILDDPNVPACLLKLWLSELPEPLIPSEFYYDLIKNAKSWEILERIIMQFPETYKHCLYYIINFLQRVITEDNKMNAPNIAIVISPNLCRCPTSDVVQMMQQTSLETEFCCTLLKYMPCVNPIFKIG